MIRLTIDNKDIVEYTKTTEEVRCISSEQILYKKQEERFIMKRPVFFISVLTKLLLRSVLIATMSLL
ncbi:MAG: hypothetical protein FWC98_00460 [Bacteroidales bacterium]|nr:hypothetical protein [Bacteroidales bacterium]